MDILELKFQNGSPILEDKDYGNPLFFISEATKGLTEDEKLIWITRCMYFELDEKQRGQLKEFRVKFPNLVDVGFNYNLYFLVQELFVMFKSKIEGLVDLDELAEESKTFKQQKNVASN